MCFNDLTDDNAIDTVLQTTNISELEHNATAPSTSLPPAPTGGPLPSPSLSPIYIGSETPDEVPQVVLLVHEDIQDK